MDLRAEFAKLLEEFGYDVLVLHSDRRIKCPYCWSQTAREPSSECSYCLGTGYACSLFRQRTRSSQTYSSPASMPINTVDVAYRSAGGPASIRYDTEIFYFPYDTLMSVNDYILRVDWNGRVPVRINDVYIIIRYDYVRGKKGRAEYLYAAGLLRPDELERFRHLFNRLRGVGFRV